MGGGMDNSIKADYTLGHATVQSEQKKVQTEISNFWPLAISTVGVNTHTHSHTHAHTHTATGIFCHGICSHHPLVVKNGLLMEYQQALYHHVLQQLLLKPVLEVKTSTPRIVHDPTWMVNGGGRGNDSEGFS